MPPMTIPSTGPSISAPRNTGIASMVILRFPVLMAAAARTVTMAANIASAARRRAVHFVCNFKTPFVTVATTGSPLVAAEAAAAPWGVPLRRRTTSHPDALNALFLLCPIHTLQRLRVYHSTRRRGFATKKGRPPGVLFLRLLFCAYFFSRVRRRVSSSTSPSISS